MEEFDVTIILKNYKWKTRERLKN